MWALILATGVALLCTPALIAGWTGLPRLDVLSPAVSTLLGFTLALGWLAWRWRRRGHPWRPMQPCCANCADLALTRSILKIGVPAALQMAMAAEIALLGLVNRHGAQATAAYGAVTQLMSWLQLPAMSLGISATILAAHAIGAGRGHRLGAIARTGLMMNVAVTGLFVCAAYALAPYAIGLFLKDGAAAAQAGELLRIVAWSVVALGCASVLSGVMRASGTVLPATLGVLAIVGVELPAAWLDARIGLSGICGPTPWPSWRCWSCSRATSCWLAPPDAAAPGSAARRLASALLRQASHPQPLQRDGDQRQADDDDRDPMQVGRTQGIEPSQ